MALVAPDGVVVVTRTRSDRQNSFAAGQKIAGPYAELVKNRAYEDKPIFIDDGASGPEVVGIYRLPLLEKEGAKPAEFFVIAVARQSDAFGTVNTIRYLNYAVLAACLVAAVLVGWWLSGVAVQPLREVSEVTRHLEHGHLDVRSSLTSTDEFGELSAQVNALIERLVDVITEISQATASVSSASTELSASAQELSQGATEQASTLQEISSSLEAVDTSVKANAQSAHTTAQAAKDVSVRAEDGGKAVEETVVADAPDRAEDPGRRGHRLPDEPPGPERRDRGRPRRHPGQGVRGGGRRGPQARREEPASRAPDRRAGRPQRGGGRERRPPARRDRAVDPPHLRADPRDRGEPRRSRPRQSTRSAPA